MQELYEEGRGSRGKSMQPRARGRKACATRGSRTSRTILMRENNARAAREYYIRTYILVRLSEKLLVLPLQMFPRFVGSLVLTTCFGGSEFSLFHRIQS